MSDPLFKLCRFISRQSVADIPGPVVRRAKCVLRDTLGVMVAGSVSAVAGNIAGQMPAHTGQGAVTWPGRPGDYHPFTAAMLGGMAGASLEFEEGHARAMGHPAVQIVPALAAAAESHGLSGARLIGGLVGGYEVACRVSQASSLREGLHPNGHWGVVGAALGVGCLLGRSAEALVEIANIAAGQAMVPFVNNSFAGCSAACTFTGLTGHAGLLANLFFDSGVRAERRSLAMTFSRFVSDSFESDALTVDLGTGYAIADSYFKPYPTCRFTHAALDALQQILDKERIDCGQVDAIEVHSFKAATHALEPPTNAEALRFSIPYLLAMMMAGHPIEPATLTEQILVDPVILKLAGKVRLVFDPAYEAMRPGRSPARVVVRLMDGRELSAHVCSGRGDALNPLSEQALANKFLSLTVPVLGPARARQALEKIDGLEKEPDVRAVMRSLRPKA